MGGKYQIKELQSTWGEVFLITSLSAATARVVLATLIPFPVSRGKVWTCHGYHCHLVVFVIFLDKPSRIEKIMSVFTVLSLTMFNKLVIFFRIPIPAKCHPFSTANTDKVQMLIIACHPGHTAAGVSECSKRKPVPLHYCLLKGVKEYSI